MPRTARSLETIRRLSIVLLTLGLVAAACGNGDEASFDQRAGRGGSTTSGLATTSTAGATTTTATVPTPAASPATTRRGTTARPGTTKAPAPTTRPAAPSPVKLTQIASLSQPLDLAARPGDGASLYVAEKGGRVRVIRNGIVDPNPVFDLSGEVSTGGEQGLLGITFDPSGAHLYAYITDRGGDVRVLELAMSGGGRRELLFVEHSSAGNHNGGGLQFGPDGQLYAAVGDGGGAGDPEGDAQNLNSRLGKILRINVATGAVAVHEYGLRNPFRFSFDRATGGIWIGDVGQNAWEEVSVDPDGKGGRNFGWNRMEGTHSYNGGTPPPNHTPPVYEYSHSGGGCVVTGGYVYRGSRMPGNNGMYVFADVCIGDLWALQNGARRLLGPKASQIVSFGQDLSGELYAVSLNGPVYRIDPA